MTDLQFQILDELYFVTSFNKLVKKTGLPSKTLENELVQLIKNEWVKILGKDLVTELNYDSSVFSQNFDSYYYLATKKGLFAHNTN